MNEKTKIGLEILASALILGVLGDALLRETPWGLNLLLWISALAAAMFLIVGRRKREMLDRNFMALGGAVVVLAGFAAWRDSVTLKVFDVMGILVILAILSLPAFDIKTRAASLAQYFLGAVNSGLNAAFAPVLLVLGDIKFKSEASSKWWKYLFSIFVGLAVAVPILFVFGALFMAADAVFESYVTNLVDFDNEFLFEHLFTFGFFAWITAGYLRGVLFGSLVGNNFGRGSAFNLSILQSSNGAAATEESAENQSFSIVPNFLRVGSIEIGIVWGLINLLFFGFVLIQLRYFFGGMDLVQNTTDFKLAEYARRGFFELVTVAALVLPPLLVTHSLIKVEDSFAKKLFRGMALLNIGLLFVIMYSAVERMLLYVGNLGYGLTTDRLYPMAFMLWLALIFVWFGLTVLRNQSHLFAWGALWFALLIVGGLHVLNPDDFIVRHNVQLMQQNREFDSYYLSNRLSADAVPALAEALPLMSPRDKCYILSAFSRNRFDLEKDDWRSWSYSRHTANSVLLKSASVETGEQNGTCVNLSRERF